MKRLSYKTEITMVNRKETKTTKGKIEKKQNGKQETSSVLRSGQNPTSNISKLRGGVVSINKKGGGKYLSSQVKDLKIVHVDDPSGKLMFERQNMWINEKHTSIVKKEIELTPYKNNVSLTCYGRKEYPHCKFHVDVYHVGITNCVTEYKSKNIVKYFAKKK